MGLNATTLVAFGAITFVAVAVGLVLRDVFAPRRATDPSTNPPSNGRAGRRASLRRPRTVFDEKPASTLLGRADQAFDRLVLESDTAASPAAGFLMVLLCGLLVGGALWLYSDEPLGGIGGALIGMTLPLIGMSVQRSRRMREIREQMPHVLDMLARACRAGQNSEQAVRLVGEEMDGVLGREFGRCGRELDLGRSFGETMKSLAGRVRTMDMRILTTTLVVQRLTGGNLPETLDRMSAVLRDRINAYRQMRASTGAGRASTLLVAAISPIAYLLMFIFHRPHLQVMYDDPVGRVLLGVAIVLEIVGILWVLTLLKRTE
jgi:tight adherence protein B